MIQIRRSKDRGYFNHGWLETYHTFSFGDYQDPRFMGFSKLRVINQDRVQPGAGFGTHSHKNMEIISYAVEGTLAHKDSMDNGSLIGAGDVQLMSAGTGVTHSEFNQSDTELTHFLQMWVLPERLETAPRYDQKTFPLAARRGRLQLMVSPDGQDGSLVIGQDVKMFGGLLAAGNTATHELPGGRWAWLHLARGRMTLNDRLLLPGDGAGWRQEEALVLAGVEDAEFVLFDLPPAGGD